MTHATSVLEFLEDLKPQGQCDDCLATELDIQPRQTINQICRSIAATGRIERTRSTCARCGKDKIVNVYRDAKSNSESHIVTAPPPLSASASEGKSEDVIDIEKARTSIVRICRNLWEEKASTEPPRSLAALITGLKNCQIIPNHVANMMLTVCNLRNVHVYEGLELGPRELLVAINAKAIVDIWWSDQSNKS